MSKADISTTPIRSRRAVLAGIASAAVIPTAALTNKGTAGGADAELIALGRKFEILVDGYYAARRPWARAMVQYRRELDKRFGADRGYPWTPESKAADKEIAKRVGLREAGDRLSAVYEKMEPIADTINAMPCTSIEGLQAKALVAFWRIAPASADDTEYGFNDEHAFQRLFCAVAELCGLKDKMAATGYEFPDIAMVDDDSDEKSDDEVRS